MAAAEPLQNLKAEVTCPICLELFWDPMTSECGHSFCRECITRHCQGDGDVLCPLCNEKLRKRNLRPNRELRNIVELVKLQPVEDPRGGDMCKMHREPLRFYCKEDQTPVCVACERSRAHRAHTVVPVEEAVQEHRESIRQQLEGIETSYETLHQLVSTGWMHLPQSAREEERQRLKRLTDNVATLLKVDTEGPRQRFAEAASQPQPRDPDWRGFSPGRKAAGETESQGHAGREPGSEREHGRKQASLDPTVHTISDTPEAAEFQVDAQQTENRSEDKASQTESEESLSRSYFPGRDVSERTEPQRHSGREPGSEPAAGKQEETGSPVVHVCEEAPTPKDRLDQASLDPTIHKVDATFSSASPQGLTSAGAAREPGGSGQDGVSPAGSVGRLPELQGCAVDVTLDPATAHPYLVLSEDWKQVELGDTHQDLPDNSERFDLCVCVLGTERFRGGRRYWEVEVGDKPAWGLGVCRESANRKGKVTLTPENGYWAVWLWDGDYQACTSPRNSLCVSTRPSRVGIFLDYKVGEVSFYNVTDSSHLFTFTDAFSGVLRPYFCPGLNAGGTNAAPLTICPVPSRAGGTLHP